MKSNATLTPKPDNQLWGIYYADRKYAGKLAFVGNVDVRVLEKGDPEAIRQMVRYKLQAARGGGWVFQSDHSVPADVKPESYELALQTLRELGDYPLKL